MADGEGRRRCPKGYFHSTELVFECGKQKAMGYVYVNIATGLGDFVVPRGVADGRFTFQAKRGAPSQVACVDPTTDATLAVLDATSALPLEANLTYTQHGVSGSWVLPSASATNSQDIVVATHIPITSTVTQLAFDSELPAALRVRVLYNASAGPLQALDQTRPPSNAPRNMTSADFVSVFYSYTMDKDCDKPSMDCLPYNASAAREAVLTWSAWVASVYPDAKAAWQDTCPDCTQEMPLHWWQAVWMRWPESNMSVVPWQAAFEYMSTLQTNDTLLSFGEFGTAFDLARVGLSIYSWCIQLHKYHKTPEEAWEALHGTEALNFDHWQSSVWQTFVAPDNFKKATAAASFGFVDANNSGVVSQAEFMNIWNECRNGYDPVTRNTATAGTSSTGQTITSTMRSEGDWATPDRSLFGTCCLDVRADCLACQANRSVADVCAMPALSRLPGCWMRPANGGPEDFRGAGCPYPGYACGPVMQGTDATHEDGPGPCQARCASTPGCSYFSFWWFDGTCVIHDADAQCSPASGAISGPAVCVAEVVTHVDDIDVAGLTQDQKAALEKSFVRGFAKVANLAVQDIVDLAGVVGAATLSEGSLLITSRVNLPSGRAFSNFTAHTREGLAGEVASALASATIPRRISGTEGISVTTKLHMECFRTGTKYHSQPAAAADGNSELPFAGSVAASSAEDCHAKCIAAKGCDSFSFSIRDGGCSLLGGPVASHRDANFVAGPRTCPPLPFAQVYEVAGDTDPTWAALDNLAQGIGLHDQGKVPRRLLLSFIVVFCFGALTFCAFSLVVRLFWGKQKSRRNNQPKYMPLQCDDKSDEGDADSDEDALPGDRRDGFSRSPPVEGGVAGVGCSGCCCNYWTRA